MPTLVDLLGAIRVWRTLLQTEEERTEMALRIASRIQLALHQSLAECRAAPPWADEVDRDALEEMLDDMDRDLDTIIGRLMEARA